MENIEERLKAMNLHMVQRKGEKLSSQWYDKDITVQQKKRKAILPKITSPSMMDKCEAELLYDISPIEKEEGVNDRNYDKNKTYDEEKEAEFPYETSTVEMKECVNDRRDDRNEKNYL